MHRSYDESRFRCKTAPLIRDFVLYSVFFAVSRETEGWLEGLKIALLCMYELA